MADAKQPVRVSVTRGPVQGYATRVSAPPLPTTR